MFFFFCATANGNRRHNDDDDDCGSSNWRNWFGKKIVPDRIRGQESKLFHGSLEQKWGEILKKMDGPPFVLLVLINQIKFVNILCDIGCLFYGIVDPKFVTKCGLERMKIIFRNMQRQDGSTNGVWNEIISIRFDINEHVENSFCYVVFKLKYDLNLGKPWMKKTVFNTILNPNVYRFDILKWKSKTFLRKNLWNWTVCKYRQHGFTCSQKRLKEWKKSKSFFCQHGWYRWNFEYETKDKI